MPCIVERQHFPYVHLGFAEGLENKGQRTVELGKGLAALEQYPRSSSIDSYLFKVPQHIYRILYAAQLGIAENGLNIDPPSDPDLRHRPRSYPLMDGKNVA